MPPGVLPSAAEHDNSPYSVNLGSGREIMIIDLVNLIASLTGYEGKIVWDHSKPDGQPRRCLDTSRAKRDFGFEAGIEFSRGLEETVAWYQANR